ncbi:MAG: transporter [Lysobacterales bacterium]
MNGFRCIAFSLLLSASGTLVAQDVEPRRWTPMPVGMNFLGVGMSYTQGDIILDPVIKAEDVTFEIAGTGLAYIRSFGVFGKSARVDISAPYASGRWEGLVDGVDTSIRRRGFLDPHVRLSVLLYGGPAQTPAEFAASPKSNTVVGAAVAIKPPVGDYMENRLINLGKNRWRIRPQLGVTHTRKKWTFELTGSVFLFGDNDEFWDGSKLESDPLYAVQGHLIYTFRPGLWLSLSAAYGNGLQSTINGSPVEGGETNRVNAVTAGIPLSRTQGLKFSWVHFRTNRFIGRDLDSLNAGWSVMF